MMNENNEIVKLKEECDLEMKSLRAELREIKFRETRLFADYSELEEENISLQKQVSVLKSSQVNTKFHLGMGFKKVAIAVHSCSDMTYA